MEPCNQQSLLRIRNDSFPGNGLSEAAMQDQVPLGPRLAAPWVFRIGVQTALDARPTKACGKRPLWEGNQGNPLHDTINRKTAS